MKKLLTATLLTLSLSSPTYADSFIEYSVVADKGNGTTFTLDFTWNNTTSDIFSFNKAIITAPSNYIYTFDNSSTSFSYLTLTQDTQNYLDILAWHSDDGASITVDLIYPISLSNPALNITNFGGVAATSQGAGSYDFTVYDQSQVTIAVVVPEPEAWAMLLLNLPVIAWFVRRKQTVAA